MTKYVYAICRRLSTWMQAIYARGRIINCISRTRRALEHPGLASQRAVGGRWHKVYVFVDVRDTTAAPPKFIHLCFIALPLKKGEAEASPSPFNPSFTAMTP